MMELNVLATFKVILGRVIYVHIHCIHTFMYIVYGHIHKNTCTNLNIFPLHFVIRYFNLMTKHDITEQT